VKDPSIGNRTVNTRGEMASEKLSFRTPFKHRRRLVLTDGFYEWQRTPDGTQPYYIRMKDGSPFAFADFWEIWRNVEEIRSCTTITTEANELVGEIHNWMLFRPSGEVFRI
jgi:putative SOS response-associated peptidase YedK